MDSEKIFFGDLYTSNIEGTRNHKKHTVLLKTFDDKYIDLEKLNWLLTLRINHKIPFTPEHALLTTTPSEENPIFVDEHSLQPYISVKTDVSLKIVRKWQKQAK